MREVIIWEADDGATFKTQDDCVKYEVYHGWREKLKVEYFRAATIAARESGYLEDPQKLVSWEGIKIAITQDGVTPYTIYEEFIKALIEIDVLEES